MSTARFEPESANSQTSASTNGANQKWYDYWEKSGFFEAESQSSKPPFVMVLPPPNVTEALHIGHAIQDIIRLPRLFRFLQRPLAQLISVLRTHKSKEAYASIGGGSPLRKITCKQVDALKSELEAYKVVLLFSQAIKEVKRTDYVILGLTYHADVAIGKECQANQMKTTNKSNLGSGDEIQHASTTDDSSETLEEVPAVGEIGGEAQIPTFYLLDSVPQWALDRLPLLVQASPSQLAQMNAFVAILGSYRWSHFTFIYKEINSASAQLLLRHCLEEVGSLQAIGDESSISYTYLPWKFAQDQANKRTNLTDEDGDSCTPSLTTAAGEIFQSCITEYLRDPVCILTIDLLSGIIF
ncbi:glutamate receptor 2.8-like protein [Tanacetum coccineum]